MKLKVTGVCCAVCKAQAGNGTGVSTREDPIWRDKHQHTYCSQSCRVRGDSVFAENRRQILEDALDGARALETAEAERTIDKAISVAHGALAGTGTTVPRMTLESIGWKQAWRRTHDELLAYKARSLEILSEEPGPT